MSISKYLWMTALCAPMLSACSDPPCEGSGNICTYMGNGRAGLGKDGTDPEKVSLYLPQDLAFGPDAQPYVLDWNNHRVRTLDAEGKVKTLIGTGYLGDAPEGDALSTSLNHPTHVNFSPTGTLILSAWHNSKVMEMEVASGEIWSICGDGSRAYRGDGEAAEDAWLDLPVATAYDSAGRLFISDQANQRIRMIDEDGVINTVVGPPGRYIPDGLVEVCITDDETMTTACKLCLTEEAEDLSCEDQPVGRPQGFAGDGGPGTEALVYMPFSQSAPPAGRIEMGPGDVLYIADTGNHRIRALTPDGVINTVAGSGPDTFDSTFKGGYGGDGGPATEALLSRPVDVAVDADGNLYIADTDNSCIRRVDAATGEISTAAGVCTQKGDKGDGGPATEALLDRPYGVALDSEGNLYIADTHNHRIRVVYK